MQSGCPNGCLLVTPFFIAIFNIDIEWRVMVFAWIKQGKGLAKKKDWDCHKKRQARLHERT